MRYQSAARLGPLAEHHRRQVQPDINGQDDHGHEPCMRDETAQNRTWVALLDGPLADALIAIRTNFVAVGDEGPAIRAHAALVHVPLL